MNSQRARGWKEWMVWSSVSGCRLGPRAYCGAVLGLVGALLSLVAALNYLVNPYAQYQPQLLPPLVQTSRATKLEQLARWRQPPGGLILGSSRVLKLEPTYLQRRTGLSFFNAGVNYGRPEDFLALLRWYQRRWSRLPKMVVIGVDVTALAERPGPDARLLALGELAETIPEALSLEDRLARWRDLISWQQTHNSFTSLARWASGSPDAPREEWFAQDGRIVYQRREEAIRQGTYDFQAALEDNMREYRQLAADFDRLSPLRCRLMHEVLQLCCRGGSEVILFVTPTHPQLLAYLDATTDYADRSREAARFLAGEASRYGFRFLRLDTVATFGGDPEQFVDGIHPLESNTRRMVDQMLRRPRLAYPYVVQ